MDLGMRERVLSYLTTFYNILSEQALFEIYKSIRRATPLYWRRAAIIDGLTHAHRRYQLHLLLPESIGFKKFLKELKKRVAINKS